jgi:thioredoxin-dependent peroxiredoxin
MSTVTEGEAAPAFTLPASGGGEVALHDLRGKNVILYFYPADDTSGCTKEACQFRDLFPNFSGADAVILGVSPDDVNSHDKFAAKYSLPFTLLADPDHEVATAYGVWTEKSNFGKKYMGIVRSTFLIGPDGKLKRIWRSVKVDDHANQVLKALAA